MTKLKNRPPSYRLHRCSRQAIVTLNGRDHYLGVYGSPESHAAYQRLVGEWLIKGTPPLPRDPTATGVVRYASGSYQTAIYKACVKAGIPTWSPNHRRHNAATFLRKEFGLDAARVILGYTSAAVTEIYAEMDRKKTAEIMGAIG